MVNPWVTQSVPTPLFHTHLYLLSQVPRAEGLHTCNAQSKTKNGVPMNRHAEIKVSRASSPVPRAVTPASPQKTSPRQAKQVVTSPIRQATPTLDEPPRPVSPVTAVVPPPAPLRVKMGSSKHVRAPRVVRAPSRALPASLAGLSARQVNDPKSYRCLNPDWTGIIKVRNISPPPLLVILCPRITLCLCISRPALSTPEASPSPSVCTSSYRDPLTRLCINDLLTSTASQKKRPPVYVLDCVLFSFCFCCTHSYTYTQLDNSIPISTVSPNAPFADMPSPTLI